MASLYPKKKSPFWYLNYIDKEGNRANKSTGLRRSSTVETAKARTLCAQVTEEEIERGNSPTENGWAWVDGFLEEHCQSEGTLDRYLNQWHWVSLFLSTQKIRHPREVRFAHGGEYMTWRKGYKKRTGKRVCHNTARFEVKLFSLVMSRAVSLELCASNPLVKLGIKKEESEEKPEITDAEFNIILPALDAAAADPENKDGAWMRTAFHISMQTGCRLKDTRLPLHRIDFERGIIHFEKPKGGKKRAFSVPLPEALRPILDPLRGQKFTLEFPFQPSRKWQQFFHRLGLDHLCFHCLRVTFITRLARANVPLWAAMRLVNHASELIHRIYQRMNVDDLRGIKLDLFGKLDSSPENLAGK